MSQFSDLVVLVPGIMGSALAVGDTEVWVPNASALWTFVKSGASSLDVLHTGHPDSKSVRATRLMPDATLVPGLFKIDGYTKAAQTLRQKLELLDGQNYREFPYDWRLDNRINAEGLRKSTLEWLAHWRAISGNPDAKVSFVCHSMGGLVARHFTDVLDGWRVTRRLITIGTPHRGSLNALRFIEHGMKKGIGPLGIDLSPILRSFPSMYQLLPTYACVQGVQDAAVKIPDAFDAGAFQHMDRMKAQDAADFHASLRAATESNLQIAGYASSFALIPVVGVEQPTSQSALFVEGGLQVVDYLDGKFYQGDGTVPTPSAIPHGFETTHRASYFAEAHGSLQNNPGVLSHVCSVLSADSIDFRRFMRADDADNLSVAMDDVILPGNPLVIKAKSQSHLPRAEAHLVNLNNGETHDEVLSKSGDEYHGAYSLSPGTWRITVSSPKAGAVTDLVVVAAEA